MESIGVRELRRDASRYVARVRAGEAFLVTDRGRPVAQLSPIVDRTGYQTLLASGRIAPGSGRNPEDVLSALDTDLPPEDGSPSAFEALLDLRADER